MGEVFDLLLDELTERGAFGAVLAAHWVIIVALWRSYHNEKRRVVQLTDQLVEVGREASLLIERITRSLT